MGKLTEAFLKTPTAPMLPRPEKPLETAQLEVKGDKATVELKTEAGKGTEDAARAYLLSKGENPDLWVATGFRSGEWTMANGEIGESNRYTFARKGSASDTDRTELTEHMGELIAAVKRHRPKAHRPEGDHAFIVALGDMQFGKIDGDGVEGTLSRAIETLNKAADALAAYRLRFDIGHVHIAWLGDHIEGFVSQGGANVWRTQLTLNEQIRLTRRVMLYAMELFAPLAKRVTMAAVPGNHGEPQRIAGKGTTRYDDSHDTESLIAVSEAAELNPAAFGHVEFYVPTTDEMTVVLDLAGTRTAHFHGHQYAPGKHFEWLKGQAFNRESQLRDIDLALAGHLHHLHIDTRSGITFCGAPSLESVSVWFRNKTGITGDPGIFVAVTRNGLTSPMEVIPGAKLV